MRQEAVSGLPRVLAMLCRARQNYRPQMRSRPPAQCSQLDTPFHVAFQIASRRRQRRRPLDKETRGSLVCRKMLDRVTHREDPVEEQANRDKEGNDGKPMQ
jgi:hypothetical protein